MSMFKYSAVGADGRTIRGSLEADSREECVDELRRRNAQQNAARRGDGKAPLPEDSRLLAAMESGLPDAVGVALGFDRLAMLVAGKKTVAEVMPFPFDRA